MWLKQSTAVTIKLGPFVDSADGDTAETSLTINQSDVRITKNGGDYAQKTEASACTHDEGGEYDCSLDATDTGTLGRLKVFCHVSGALAVWKEFMVFPANVFNSLVAGSDNLEVDTTLIEGVDATDQINTEVLDVLNVDTFAEPGQEAPATPNTLVAKIGYLYKFMRNKVETTATEIAIYNDDGTTKGQKSTISDDGTTTTRGEFGTGA